VVYSLCMRRVVTQSSDWRTDSCHQREKKQQEDNKFTQLKRVASLESWTCQFRQSTLKIRQNYWLKFILISKQIRCTTCCKFASSFSACCLTADKSCSCQLVKSCMVKRWVSISCFCVSSASSLNVLSFSECSSNRRLFSASRSFTVCSLYTFHKCSNNSNKQPNRVNETLTGQPARVGASHNWKLITHCHCYISPF